MQRLYNNVTLPWDEPAGGFLFGLGVWYNSF